MDIIFPILLIATISYLVRELVRDHNQWVAEIKAEEDHIKRLKQRAQR